MSCYHPILALPDYDSGVTESGKFKYKLYGSYNPGFKDLYPDSIKVPCGKCLGCRLDYSRSWADRMMLELDSNNGKGMFVTLTYNNEHVPYVQDGDLEDVPVGYTLLKRDLQLFFKRLRDHFPGNHIRYYACGEYGSKTKRPHYHAILFGLGLDDFTDLRRIGVNELGQDYFTSSKFENIWQNGYVVLSDVSYKTCAYVSRYVMKKAYDVDAPFGADPEFVVMSRRPGLGSSYYAKNPECMEKSHIFLSDSNGSVKVSIPKYFLDKLKVDNPSLYAKMKLDRIKYSSDREFLKLQNTSLSYIDYLELEENVAFNKTKILFNLRE